MRDFPTYIQHGSYGPAINVLLQFLASWAAIRRGLEFAHGIRPDCLYGDTGVRWMQEFQRAHHLDADGGCGPQTRKFIKTRYGFDLELEMAQIPGTNYFVQVDGTRIAWKPVVEGDVSHGQR